MSSDLSVSGEQDSDPALQEAVKILENADDKVIAHIFTLLTESVSDKSRWEPKHTTNILGVLSSHLETAADVRKYELDCKERIVARNQFPYLIGMTFCGVLLLCWMFLHYGKPEFIAAVITGIAGFVGGYGYGKGTAERK